MNTPGRPSCPYCRWPLNRCSCATIQPIATRSRLVFLMHPKEARRQRTGTGRLTHLCLPNSEILVADQFDQHARLAELLADPERLPFLLYPDATALSPGQLSVPTPGQALLFLIVDATWSCAQKMLRRSSQLQALPRIRFSPVEPSAWVFKQQPAAYCLSTLETVHCLLLELDQAGLENYDNQEQLPRLFAKLQTDQTNYLRPP